MALTGTARNWRLQRQTKIPAQSRCRPESLMNVALVATRLIVLTLPVVARIIVAAASVIVGAAVAAWLDKNIFRRVERIGALLRDHAVRGACHVSHLTGPVPNPIVPRLKR